MKILVYGAGVIGCELAHMLCAKHEVSLLARGTWKEELEFRGLVMRHNARRKTTVDVPQIVGELPKQEAYDLIFVAVQAEQREEVLPIVSKNVSSRIVLVGNDADATASWNRVMQHATVEKEIAFAFLHAAGHREEGAVVSVVRRGMTVGGLNEPLSPYFQTALDLAFADTGCKLCWENQMDVWLKCHLALVLPTAYVCYAVRGDWSLVTKEQRNAILEAAREGCAMLRHTGLAIRPWESEDWFKPGAKRAVMSSMLAAMTKTSAGQSIASEHYMCSIEELRYLDGQFETMREQVPLYMPVWERLRSAMPDWETLEAYAV